MFGTTKTLPRRAMGDDHTISSVGHTYGSCEQDVSRLRAAPHLTVAVWCYTFEWYRSNITGAVYWADQATSLIRQGGALSRCLDTSPWPFQRKQLLVNFRIITKIAHSSFKQVNLPKTVMWLGHKDTYTIVEDRLDQYVFVPDHLRQPFQWKYARMEVLSGMVRRRPMSEVKMDNYIIPMESNDYR